MKKTLGIIGLMLVLSAIGVIATHGGKHGDKGIYLGGCNKEFNLQLRHGATYHGYTFDSDRNYIKVPITIENGQATFGSKTYELDTNAIEVGSFMNNDVTVELVKNYGGVSIVKVKTTC